MKIFVFGNEFMDNDSSAKEFARKNPIEGVEYIDCKSVSDLFNSGEKDMVILDVVENIDLPIIISDIDQLAETRSVSAHDMDLSFHLKLYKELGIIEKVTIIGIPQSYSEEYRKTVRNFIQTQLTLRK